MSIILNPKLISVPNPRLRRAMSELAAQQAAVVVPYATGPRRGQILAAKRIPAELDALSRQIAARAAERASITRDIHDSTSEAEFRMRLSAELLKVSKSMISMQNSFAANKGMGEVRAWARGER